MSEARFTPGPWRLDHDPLLSGVFSDDENYHGIEAGNGFISGGYGFKCTGFMSKNDAALIVAAPYLYEALEFAVRELRLVRDGSLHGTPNSVFALIPEAIEKADAALSRARGE